MISIIKNKQFKNLMNKLNFYLDKKNLFFFFFFQKRI
jgi:hypothetical protein